MISVDRAILHVFDLDNPEAILSDAPLTLTDELGAFLSAHIEKCLRKASARPGGFQPTSAFHGHVKEYLAGGDFTAFSKAAAQLWFDVLRQAENMAASDLLVCDVREDGARYLALLRMGNRRALFHEVIRDGERVRNDIRAQTAVLPAAAGSVHRMRQRMKRVSNSRERTSSRAMGRSQ